MRNPLLLSLALLGGCATDCASDWYALGQRDGRINAGSQAMIYASQCPGKVDEARYGEGYREGFSHRPVPGW